MRDYKLCTQRRKRTARYPFEYGKQKEWNENSLKKFAYIILRYPGEWMAQRAFDRMRKLHLKLTPACYTQKELKLLKADVFMTGSDQVWGPLFKVKYDPTYFLDFTDSTSKKYRMPPALDIQSLPPISYEHTSSICRLILILL